MMPAAPASHRQCLGASLWHDARSTRLTSSMFGRISVARCPQHPPHIVNVWAHLCGMMPAAPASHRQCLGASLWHDAPSTRLTSSMFGRISVARCPQHPPHIVNVWAHLCGMMPAAPASHRQCLGTSLWDDARSTRLTSSMFTR